MACSYQETIQAEASRADVAIGCQWDSAQAPNAAQIISMETGLKAISFALEAMKTIAQAPFIATLRAVMFVPAVYVYMNARKDPVNWGLISFMDYWRAMAHLQPVRIVRDQSEIYADLTNNHPK